MKYHLDTIPVWEAMEHPGECPLCQVRDKIEGEYISVFLGGALMDPDIRVETNAKGFCPAHFQMLYDGGNRLGLGLMSHTRLIELRETIAKDAEAMARAIHADQGRSMTRRAGDALKGGGQTAKALRQAQTHLAAKHHCAICERMEQNMARYLFTFLHLYKTEPRFVEAMRGSNGFCIPHYQQLLAMAGEQLSGKVQRAFLLDLTELQVAQLERLEGEIKWFTEKFDHRNTDAPWGTSRDALQRTFKKLVGRSPEKEPPKKN